MFVLALLGFAAPLPAADEALSDSVVTQIKTLSALKRARTPAQQKLASPLIHRLKQKRGELAGLGLGSIRATLDVRPDGLVLVDIRATITDALLAQITQGGGTVVLSVPSFDEVRAWMSLEQIEALAARGEVRFIRPAEQAFTNVGPINSQGDTNHRALMARTNFGVSGTGIKVGVLSDSVDFLAASQGSGELGPVTVIENVAGSGEGTAMLEIVRDVAPNSQLYFATAFTSAAGFATNIIRLWTNGCSVIVDDVGYFSESPFQDDVIARAVNTVTAGGALYFSSAANSGNKNDNTSGTWEGDFVDAGAAGAPLAGAGNLHSFGVSNYNTVIAGGSSRRADLFWSDPLGASANDYDLYILDATGTSVVALSDAVQNGTQNPYEAVGSLNVGERIVITKFAGANRFIHLSTGRARLSISTAGNTRGHSAATNAFSVAAVQVLSGTETAFVGGAPNPVETFSSDGTRRVFYHADGTPITPGNFSSTGGAVRQKPDIAAADGGRTSVPGFDPFFGTSAAAPHAAGIAALIRSLNPGWTPAQIRSALTGSALDIEAAGVDRDSGAGIVMAQQAMEHLTAVTIPTALDTTGLTWNTGGITGWIGLSNVTHDAVDAAASRFITHSQENWMETTVTGPGELRYWWKVSSEAGNDVLELLVDGVAQPGAISGQVDWQRKTNSIAAGNHNVRFRYRKNGTVNVGTDRGWVDQVTFGGLELLVPPGPTNGGITSILLFVPDESVVSSFRTALDFSGRTYQYFTSESLFTNALNASTPASTLAIVDSIDTNPNFTSLISFVAAGGRSIVYYWDLDANAPLATAFNCSVAQDIFTPQNVNNWGGSAFFHGVTSPLVLTERGYNDDGDRLQATGGGIPVGGYTASINNTQACIIIGNSGRTIINSMALQDSTGNPAAAAQFALNEIFYLLAPLHTGGRVAVVGADLPAWTEDVRQKLLGTGAFTAVDVIQADTTTPTLGQLQPYRAVLVYSDNSFNNGTTLGNALADYADGGGLVVVSTFALYDSGGGGGLQLAGRIVTGGYLPFIGGTQDQGTELTLVPVHADHPILAGVGSFSGGTSSYRNLATLAPGGVLVAKWSDQTPLVMTKKTGVGRVVGLNLFPPSETVRNDFWRTNTAGARLMANALQWNGFTPTPPVTPTNGGVASILLFVDETSVPSAYQSALDYAGLPYQLFTALTPFTNSVATSAPNSTLVIVDSISNNHDLSRVATFVGNGGRALMYYWDLDGSPGLATAFNVTTVQDIFTPVPVNDWGGSFFFSNVGSPLNLFERGYNDDGDKLQPTAGGVAVAGHTASPASGQAAIVIGNSGRTIVNSMALQDATSAPILAAQLAMNEIFYLLAPPRTGGQVAVLGAEQASWNEDVRQKLLGTGDFLTVDVVQANAVTPTLPQLQAYTAVLAYSDGGFINSTTLGNNLADYVDGGGIVVVSTFALYPGGGLGIEGRLSTGGYLPFVPGNYASGTELTLGTNHPDHPIMAGVSSLSGGTSSYHNLAALAPNAALVARWNNGVPLVMTKKTGAGTVVGLNFFPPSETVRNDLWRTNTAGGRLMANALRFNGPSPIPPVISTNGGSINSILLFVDDTSVPSAYQSALDYAGLPYQLFTDEASFNSTVSTSAPNSTLAIVDSIDTGHTLAPLITFVANGGRALMYYWNLDGSAGLAAAFNVATVQDIFTPVPVNDWGGSFFFSNVGSPLNLFERGYNDDGDKLQPTPGGFAVAGHTASPAAGQAAVVIGNSGRTIVNSMALQDATNAPIAAAQFALNEIFFLLAPGGGGRVAVLGAETPEWTEDVRQKLLASGAFEAVDVMDVRSFTPTLAQLQPYSAVLVYSDYGFDNAALLGNVLADYADAGGGVVMSTFTTLVGNNVTGRLVSGGYLPFVAGGFGTGSDLSLVPDQAVHPILAGVTSLVGGLSSYHGTVSLAPNSSLVAHWNNGVPLVMTKLTGSARVVGLNFFPVSQTMRSDFWRTNTAGGLLMANALRWSAIPDCTVRTNYTAATTFTDALGSTTMSLAFDGTNLWSASGDSTIGNRLARYTPAGAFVAAYAPGIDFRSLFADAGGRLYARGFNSANILRQTTPGTFVTHVTLVGGSLNAQAAVVLNGNANEYVAMDGATVSRWSTNGSFIGTVTLAGFGTGPGENNYPQNVKLAAVGNSWLTYNNNRVLSIWSPSGARLSTTLLQGAGIAFSSLFSFSYCAGKAWVIDAPGGLWRGFDICTSPEPFRLSRPVRVAGGQFQMNLQGTPLRSYTVERSSNFVSWVPFTTFVPLAPNTTVTDPAATGHTNLFYRARQQ